jgi:hypothetical protein
VWLVAISITDGSTLVLQIAGMLFLVVVLLHHTCATTLATSCDNHFVIVNRLASALSNEARSLKVYVDFIYRRHLGDTVSSSGGMAQRPRDYLRKALVCIDSAEDYSVPKPLNDAMIVARSVLIAKFRTPLTSAPLCGLLRSSGATSE